MAGQPLLEEDVDAGFCLLIQQGRICLYLCSMERHSPCTLHLAGVACVEKAGWTPRLHAWLSFRPISCATNLFSKARSWQRSVRERILDAVTVAEVALGSL